MILYKKTNTQTHRYTYIHTYTQTDRLESNYDLSTYVDGKNEHTHRHISTLMTAMTMLTNTDSETEATTIRVGFESNDSRGETVTSSESPTKMKYQKLSN